MNDTLDDDRHLWYSAARYNGGRSTVLKQWQQCVYDVRAPPTKPVLHNYCRMVTEDSLTVRWELLTCDRRMTSSKTVSFSLRIRETEGNGIYKGEFDIGSINAKRVIGRLNGRHNYGI